MSCSDRATGPWREVGELLASLYATVDRLEELFPGQKFTPDGHLVGSIGEVIAAYIFDLELLPNSFQKHDAKAPDGRLVQIKLTQGNRSINISGEPDFMIALRLAPDHSVEVVYNGPGVAPWNAAGKMQKNGQRPIALSKLRLLSRKITDEERIAPCNKLQLRPNGETT